MTVSLSPLAVVGAALAATCYLLYHKVLPKPIPGIPYNRDATRSIFGDFPSFKRWHDTRPELYNWLVEQSVKLDSPVIQVFMRPFSKPWVILADFYEAEDIMARRTKEFGRADMFGDFFAPLLPNSHIHMPMGDEWRSHRRLIGDVVTPEFLGQVAGPQVYSRAVDCMRLWKEKVRLARGRPFPAMKDVTYSALEVMWAVAFGFDVGAIAAQLDLLSSLPSVELNPDSKLPVDFPIAETPSGFNAVVSLTTSVEIALSSPFPRPTYWFALNCFPRLRRAMKEKNKMIKERLDEAYVKFTKYSDEKIDRVRSATELFVQREVALAKKEKRPAQYDSPIIRDELFGLLVAGLDTTSITVCWGLKHLTANQEVQSHLRSVLREHYHRAYKAGEAPTVQEIVEANPPYLEATIEEIHRLGGTASVGSRVALCDTQILGHHIPRGTDVFTLSQGPGYVSKPLRCDDHQRTAQGLDNTSKWGAWEPSTIGDFVPERWLVEGIDGQPKFNAFAGPAHPFGAGPRGCFGRKFAALELKIIITLVVWTFVLNPTPGELSSFAAQDLMVHTPQQMYLQLSEAR